jgi:hypothetical protein
VPLTDGMKYMYCVPAGLTPTKLAGMELAE